jgi:2-haloacid dehalogenase
MKPEQPKALTFDVFGTVVDLSGTLASQGDKLLRSWGIKVGWAALAAQWVTAYSAMIEQVNLGAIPWANADVLASQSLEATLAGAGLKVSQAQKLELAAIWGSLEPWPDSKPGLVRLRGDHLVFALSNGTAETLAQIARHGGLPWDGIFSAGSVRAFKPDPRVYHMALDGLGLTPGEVMMVASHRFDLDAAKGCGMQTAFIARPQEPAGTGSTTPDISCSNILELATLLH